MITNPCPRRPGIEVPLGAVRKQLKRIGVQLVGWVFIVLGIAGLFLPVLQGILFLLIGLLILSTEYAWAHHFLAKLQRRFPKISRHFEQARQRAERWRVKS